MKVSKRGLAEIAGHEGIVTSRYKDSVGVWTLGIGHTAAAGAPDPKTNVREYSISEIMDIFARDIGKFEARVRKAFTRELTQSQFDAAVSFDFNTGGIHKASWVTHYNAGNDAAAKKAFMNWSKPKEIIPRRRAERDLFFGGGYGNGFANIYPASASGAVQWGQGKRVNVLELLGGGEPVENDAILKRGSKGPYVRELQSNLKAIGYVIAIDGDFGVGTEAAVKAFQARAGLKPDGWAGPRTLDALGRAVAEMKAAPKIEKAADDAKGKAAEQVEKKTGMWGWLTGLVGSGGLGIASFAGMDWQTVAALGGVVVVFLIVILVMRRQIIGAVKDIRNAVEDGA